MPVAVTRLGPTGTPLADLSFSGLGRVTAALATAAVGATIVIAAAAGTASASLGVSGAASGIASSGVGTATAALSVSGRASQPLTMLGPTGGPVPYFELQSQSVVFWSVACSAVINGDVGPIDDVQIVLDGDAIVNGNVTAFLHGVGSSTATLTVAGRAGSQGTASASLTVSGAGQAIGTLFSAGGGSSTATLTATAAAPTQGAGASTPTLTVLGVGASSTRVDGAGTATAALTVGGVGFAVDPSVQEAAGAASAALTVAGEGVRLATVTASNIATRIVMAVSGNSVRLNVGGNRVRLTVQR